MGTLSLDQDFGFEMNSKQNYEKPLIIEEIKDVIKVHKTGNVERSIIEQSVSPFLAIDLNVTSRDVFIDREKNIWARTYVPKYEIDRKFPLLVYFHGGGFCVGSTSWKCYHEFLGILSSKSKCIIISVNYRLAPENRLPAAYEDGIKALMWVKQQENGPSSEYWTKYCDFSRIFLGGDNAGGNIAYNVSLELGTSQVLRTIDNIKGIIMIQPLFGGEDRTDSEKSELLQSSKSNLSVRVSDTCWRLALPIGADRDHPWCNPIREGVRTVEKMRVMFCVAEKDVLRDRNMELCLELGKVGNNEVDCMVYEGVGHAFQIVDKSLVSQIRKQQLISDIADFITSL